MRPQRNKQFDWTKPFKLIQNIKEFDSIQTGQDLVISIPNKQTEAQAAQYKKQNIITPRIQTLARVTSVKPFAKITPNYIRLPQRLNLPKLIDYELTEVQNVFVKTHSQKYRFKGKVILTNQFLSKVFIQLELKAGKDPVIPRNKGWMMRYLQQEHKQLLQWQLLQNFASLVYNFWRNRRQQLKFPLLRPLWRPNPDEFNHLLAFKPRQKQKRNLRKTTRISQQDILSELTDEFNLAKQITQRVQLRQQTRLKLLQTQLSMFHNECKSLFGQQTFFGEVNSDSRGKDKQKLKSMHHKLDKIKMRRQQPIEPQVVPVYQPQQVYDQKLSVACFLSTVIAEAQVFGINYQSIFQNRSVPLSEPVFAPAILPVNVVEEPVNNQPTINMSLHRAENFLIRDFDIDQQQSSQQFNIEQQIIYPKRYFSDLFDFKKSKITSFYFGQDDEGDYKQLRKNISTSFKKFQSQVKPV